MHYIQLAILDKLLRNEVMRYSVLRPDGIESNHFSYHLKELQRERLVAKVEGGYTLAPKGLAYVDSLSHKHMKPRKQPKIITTVFLEDHQGKVLLFRRNYQPYIHRLGPPSGKLHLEETMLEAARRELYEKTGVTVVPIKHRGLVNLEVRQQGYVISHVMAHIFSGRVVTPPNAGRSSRGECSWAKLSTYTRAELMPATRKIHKLLNNQAFFYEEMHISE